MAKEKVYKVVIALPAQRRYQETVLVYLLEHFKMERVIEIDQKIRDTAASLARNPNRGSSEKYLSNFKNDFRFILYKEAKTLEIKIIFFVDERTKSVNITDFFPTKMDPNKISRRS